MSKRTLFGLLGALVLAGCASPPPAEPPPPPPVTLDVAIAAAADVNPDSSQRASPLVLRVYELEDAEAFATADFFSVWNKESATLAAALVKRHELPVAPAGKTGKQLTLDPRVRFVGVAAAFRDIRNAQWRVVVPVSQDPAGPRAFKLDVAATGTTATASLEPAPAPVSGSSP
jgi:type VI secretion system protein VasD